jgi:hypothetical protein
MWPNACLEFNAGWFRMSLHIFTSQYALVLNSGPLNTCVYIFSCRTEHFREPGQLSQCSDWVAGWTARVRFPAGTVFLFRHRVQVGSGVHPLSYQVSSGYSFPGGKETRAWSWLFTSHLASSWSVELYLHSQIRPHDVMLNYTGDMCSWRGTWLSIGAPLPLRFQIFPVRGGV